MIICYNSTRKLIPPAFLVPEGWVQEAHRSEVVTKDLKVISTRVELKQRLSALIAKDWGGPAFLEPPLKYPRKGFLGNVPLGFPTVSS